MKKLYLLLGLFAITSAQFSHAESQTLSPPNKEKSPLELSIEFCLSGCEQRNETEEEKKICRRKCYDPNYSEERQPPPPPNEEKDYLWL